MTCHCVELVREELGFFWFGFVYQLIFYFFVANEFFGFFVWSQYESILLVEGVKANVYGDIY